MTGMALGCIEQTSAFGSVVRNAKRSLVVSPSFTFRTTSNWARCRRSRRGDGFHRVRTGYHSLNELNGTTQRFSGPSHLFQCLLFTLRMFVVPPSGSIRSSSLKSTGLPFASSFAARFLVASIKACCDDGIPDRAVASSRPSGPLRTIGAL